MYLPLVGRIGIFDWPVIVLSFLLAWSEFIISTITVVLPDTVISLFTLTVKMIYRGNPLKSELIFKTTDLPHGINQKQYNLMVSLSKAETIQEMVACFGYEVIPHVMKTKDNYVLTIHRISGKPRQPNGKIAYLHHGLLMCSEVWVTMLEKHKNLPFILYELGYDVWLGNNRGNKYGQKHVFYEIESVEFWNFSIDDFAIFDIPDIIDYILDYTKLQKLTYIGFSQGTAQAFASISINPHLNKKIEQFIAISPATTPHGLNTNFLDVLLKSSPNLMYLLFSRKILMPSITFWRRIVYPSLFDLMIDWSNWLLFDWKSDNITKFQKISSFAHLYSTTSVKVVVHWFQIMKHKNFQMYHESSRFLSELNPTVYNLKLIQVPIHLIYGTIDSLVDIDIMRDQLPRATTTIQPVENHEHLDNLWGEDVYEVVFKHVLTYLGEDVSYVDRIFNNLPPSIEEIVDDDDTFVDQSYLKSSNRAQIHETSVKATSARALSNLEQLLR
jgi:lysosomal acid lipase/cholesteryl ester hydrolase